MSLESHMVVNVIISLSHFVSLGKHDYIYVVYPGCPVLLEDYILLNKLWS